MHVLHLLYEPRPSGISRFVLEVVRMLPDLRHTVLLPRGLGEVAPGLREAGAAVELASIRSRLLPRSTWRELPGHIRRARPDVLHLHALETGPFGTLAGLLGGARRIVFSPQTIEIRQRALLPLLRRVLRLAGRRHAAWTCAARDHVEALRAIAPPDTAVHLVPNAVPRLRPLVSRAVARERLGWPGDAFVVAFAGRLAVQKDPWTFVRSAAGAPELLHVLVGDGPLRAELEPAARRWPWVRLQGEVAGLEDVYAGADVLCLPSRWEGMPLTLLGALACALPVVATRVPGNSDLVLDGRTGLLIEPGDDVGLRAALRRLAADPGLRRTLGEGGRAHVETSYSPAAVAARLRAVYEEAARP